MKSYLAYWKVSLCHLCMKYKLGHMSTTVFLTAQYPLNIFMTFVDINTIKSSNTSNHVRLPTVPNSNFNGMEKLFTILVWIFKTIKNPRNSKLCSTATSARTWAVFAKC